jgi:hypothetical protein
MRKKRTSLWDKIVRVLVMLIFALCVGLLYLLARAVAGVIPAPITIGGLAGFALGWAVFKKNII